MRLSLGKKCVDTIGFRQRNKGNTLGKSVCVRSNVLEQSAKAEFCSTRFGSLRTEHYNLIDWHSLVVRLPADEKIKPELIADGNPDAIREFYNGCERWQLAFLNAAGEPLLAIENLSKPEALWMADVVLREQRTIR